MRAEGLVRTASSPSECTASKRYLRALFTVARSARRGEYALVYLRSGCFFRTDRLGAIAARALIAGRSDIEAMELVEHFEGGAGERARRLIDVLDLWHGMTWEPALAANRRARLRRLARVTGMGLSVLGPLVQLAPVRVLAWLGGILPMKLMVEGAWRPSRRIVASNLRAIGYSDRSEPEVLIMSRLCVAAPPRNYVFMYLSTVLSTDRLRTVVDRLFDAEPADKIAARFRSEGPMIGVFLHGPLCVAVPNALRNRGVPMVRVVVPWTHGINVSESDGPLKDFFGDSPDLAVVTGDPLVSGVLLRQLKAGRSIYIALDEPIRGRKPKADVEMLGRRVPRNDAPAWLAVRSKRPLALCTTYSSPSGTVLSTSQLLYPDPSLPAAMRVADLSERLYACAATAIAEHPESWGSGWVEWGPQPAGQIDRSAPQQTVGPVSVRTNV